MPVLCPLIPCNAYSFEILISEKTRQDLWRSRQDGRDSTTAQVTEKADRCAAEANGGMKKTDGGANRCVYWTHGQLGATSKGAVSCHSQFVPFDQTAELWDD